MTDAPSLPDLLTIVGGGGIVVGGVLGWVAPTRGIRQMFEAIAAGAGVGGFVGSAVAFVMYFVQSGSA